MKNYKILEYEYSDDLERNVIILIEQGWKCQGGLAIIYKTDEDGFHSYAFFQALIKD